METKTENIVQIAKKYAIKCHSETNHKYDDLDYHFHLTMVVQVGLKFIDLIPEEDRENVIAGIWCHDIIEDARQTYNDVKKATNEQVAELSYALTNEKGKNRSERACDKYYEGILNTPYAVFIKLCDRIANVQYSISQQSRMLELYRKENENFSKKIWDFQYVEMFDYLKELLNSDKSS